MFVVGQRSVTGRVMDLKTGDELPFATVQLQNSSMGTITNENGFFRIVIPDHYKTDTLIFSFVGYEIKKLSIDQIVGDAKIFLKPIVHNIRELTVVEYSNESIFRLLNRVIHLYRTSSEKYVSKSLLTLISYNDSIPVEIIEAMYNASITKSNGLNDLVLKMGRYGHTNDLQFYSMNTTDLLKNYALYQIDWENKLPLWPGKMTQRSIKKNYTLKVSQLHNDSLIKIDFISTNRNIFNGYLIIDLPQLSISEIRLYRKEPNVNSLVPIDTTHTLYFTNMELGIKYNSLNKNRPEIINFQYSLKYKISNSEYKINTNVSLHFFDYDQSFLNPIYTSDPYLLNDYERIIGNGFDEKFWNNNYNLPFDNASTRLLSFFADSGLTINFNSEPPSVFFDHFSFPLVFWDDKTRIGWKHFNENSKPGKKKSNHAEALNKVMYSDLYKADIGFFINPLEKNLAIDSIIVYTYFNKRSSFFFPKPEGKPITLFNILFDYYHIQGEKFIQNYISMCYPELSQRISRLLQDCSSFEKKIVVSTNLGKNTTLLKEYNDEIAKITNIDNFSIDDFAPIINKERNIHDLGPKYYLEIANELFSKKDYKNSLLFLDKAENAAKTKELHVAINYNRALVFISLNDYSKAKFYLEKNVLLNDLPSIELLKTIDDNHE